VASPLETGATLADLQSELYARGYDHLAQDAAGVARGLRWINQAAAELTLAELWPFRLSTATGAAPLSITTLSSVLSVIDTGNASAELSEMTERELVDAGIDLTDTGTPLYWYRDSLQIKTYPVGGTLSVRYWALPTDLASPTDQTLVPARFMDAIVDGAVRRAAKDRDNWETVGGAEQERQRGLELMRRTLLVAPTHIQKIPFTSEDD
jgi:hypothetical protein